MVRTPSAGQAPDADEMALVASRTQVESVGCAWLAVGLAATGLPVLPGGQVAAGGAPEAACSRLAWCHKPK